MSVDETLKDASDEELLKRIAARDDDAAEVIHQRYVAEVTGFVARRVTAEELEDTVQDIMLRILMAACSYAGRSSVRAWIYGVARQTLWERFRKRDLVVSQKLLEDAGSGPESLALAAERRRQIVSALQRLPDDQAIVLELHRIDGLSHDEIAKLLGISRGTSRKRLERATKFMKANSGKSLSAEQRHSRIDSWRKSLLRRAVPGLRDRSQK